MLCHLLFSNRIFKWMNSQKDTQMMSCWECCEGDVKTKSKKNVSLKKNLTVIGSLKPTVSLHSISRKGDCCFEGLSPSASAWKMTIVDTGCWPKAISPLWPNSPQRCKHYMEEWPTDRPQRLQSEGQWFVQQPIRGVCVCDRVGVSLSEWGCVWLEGGDDGKLNHPVLKRT